MIHLTDDNKLPTKSANTENVDLGSVISIVKQYRHGSLFRCDVYGKFISYAEVHEDKIETYFIPDTQCY